MHEHHMSTSVQLFADRHSQTDSIVLRRGLSRVGEVIGETYCFGIGMTSVTHQAPAVPVGGAPSGSDSLDVPGVLGGAPQELGAAALFLESHTSRKGLADEIVSLVSGGDARGATKVLSDAFVTALEAGDDSSAGSSSSRESLEGCMQVLLMWVKECGMEDKLVREVAASVASGAKNADLRLRCIALLYNGVSEDRGQVRFDLLLSLVRLASAAGLVPKVRDTILPLIDRFLAKWKVGLEDMRKMYRACYDALVRAGYLDDAFQFNLKQLALYNNASPDELASVENEAIEAIKDTVRLRKLYRFDTLLELSAVKQLGSSSDPKHKVLYELLSIFVKDDLDAYMTYRGKNDKVLMELGIDDSAAVDKMRLLTFASLGIDSQDLSYSAIASALHIPESDVEEWVIRAISSGLVDVKINQLKSSVAVYRSTQRMFTREEWQPLSERINIWKANIAELLTSLRETRQRSENAAAEAMDGLKG